ncbi:DUF2786 domain-containing protein [Vibrio owensii]|uniref:DUF2786 domain-containing protein n=1 Tax=Vibrio owensii TaxID=696485 RepID=UPI00339AA166
MTEKHLAKIKKCLELSKSANENEAAQALKMAQSLMRKYGLVDSDVDFIDWGKFSSSLPVPKNPPRYLASMVNKIANIFAVKPLLDQFSRDARIVFIGPESRATIAAYAFDVAYRALMNARSDYVSGLHKNCKPYTKTKRGDEFALGWVLAAIFSLDDMELNEDESKKLDDYYKSSGDYVSTTVIDREAKDGHKYRADGRNAGSKFKLNHGVTGKTERKAIGSK